MTLNATTRVYEWHPLLQCGLLRVEVDFRKDSVLLFLPDGECVDMTGAISYAMQLHPEVRRIHTFAGSHRDTSYFRLFNDKWEARQAPLEHAGQDYSR